MNEIYLTKNSQIALTAFKIYNERRTLWTFPKSPLSLSYLNLATTKAEALAGICAIQLRQHVQAAEPAKRFARKIALISL